MIFRPLVNGGWFEKTAKALATGSDPYELNFPLRDSQKILQKFELLETVCHSLSIFIYKNFDKHFTREMIKNELSKIKELEEVFG